MNIPFDLLDDYFSRSRDFVSFTGSLVHQDCRYYPLVHNNRFVVIQGPGIEDMRDVRKGLEIIQSQVDKISFDPDGPSYYFMAEVTKGRWKIICGGKTKARFKIQPEAMPFARMVHERDINITNFTWTDTRFGEWEGKQVECYFSWNDYTREFMFRNIQGHRLADHLGVIYPILAHIIDDDEDVIGEITERKEGRLVEFGDWALVRDACQKLLDNGLLLEGPLPDNIMLTKNNEVRFLRVHNIIKLPMDSSEREAVIDRMWYRLRVNVFEKITQGNPLPMPGEGRLIPRLIFPNTNPHKLMSGTGKMLVRVGLVLMHQEKFVRARQDACRRGVCHLPEHFPWDGVKTKWNNCSASDLEGESAGTHQIVMSYDGPNANLPEAKPRKRKHIQVDATQEVQKNTVQTSYAEVGIPRYILENLVLQRIDEELLPDRVKRKTKRYRNIEGNTSNSAQVPTTGRDKVTSGPKCSQPLSAPAQDLQSVVATIPNPSHHEVSIPKLSATSSSHRFTAYQPNASTTYDIKHQRGNNDNAHVPRLLEVDPPKKSDSGNSSSRLDPSCRTFEGGCAATKFFTNYDRDLPVPDIYLGRPKTPPQVRISSHSRNGHYPPFEHNRIVVDVGYEHLRSLAEGSSDASGNAGDFVKKRKLDPTLPSDNSSEEYIVRRRHRHKNESTHRGHYSQGLRSREARDGRGPTVSKKGTQLESGVTAEPYPAGYIPVIQTYAVGQPASRWEESSGSRIEEVEE